MDTKNKHTDYAGEVVRRYFRGRYPAEVEENVQQWLIDPTDEEQKFQSLENEWQRLKIGFAPSVDRSFRAVQARIDTMIVKPATRFRHMMARAAAVIIPAAVIALGVAVYIHRQKDNKEIAWIEYSVPYGQKADLKLPDGSILALNSATTVAYPEKFTERCVKLSGEAAFKVETDPAKPFVVITEFLTVQVVGTEFNVLAIKEIDKEVVSVAGGEVQVKTAAGDTHSLRTGDQLTLDKELGSVILERFEPSDPSWKSGVLAFTDNTCSEIFSMIRRHYDIPFHYAGKCSNNQRYTLKFADNETVEQVMQILETLIAGFTYEIRDDGIHIEYH